MEKQREAERRKRARDAQSINFTSQSEIMACIERSLINDVNTLPQDPGLMLGLHRTEDEEEVL
jgi:hypothetical protein